MANPKLLKIEIFLFLVCFLMMYLFNTSLDSTLLNTITNIGYVLTTMQYLYIYKRHTLFCFELLFSLSFWLCCFLFPIIADIIAAKFSLVSDDILIKVTLLSFIGYMCYMAGLIYNKKTNICKTIKNYPISNNFNKIINIATLVFVLLFFVLGGWRFIYSYDSSLDSGLDNRFGAFGSAMSYMIMFLNIGTVTNFLQEGVRKRQTYPKIIKALSKLYLLCAGGISLFFLLSGYRSGAMQIVIPMFVMLFIVHRISAFKLLMLMICGCAFLVLIGYTRTNSSSDAEQLNSIDAVAATRDFHYSNYGLIMLYEHTESEGPTMGSNAISQIISPIPFAQSILIAFIGDDNMAPSSSKLFTDTMNFGYGLGTNIIGDIYYTFGFWGIILLMWILGFSVSKFSSMTNIYCSVAYLILCGNAVFAPRVEFFYILRTLGFAMISIYLISQFVPYKLKRIKAQSCDKELAVKRI